tara:strand:+ start:790 stop:1239 length:450 start_codon:yes stop_codon:yes gene_type:complete
MAKKKTTRKKKVVKKEAEKALLSNYEQYKANQEKDSKGLGDTIAKVAKATGLDKAAKFIAGEDCGCDERKDVLNKLFKYEKPECLEEDEFNFIKDWKALKKSNVNYEEKVTFFKISNRIFSKKQSANSSCGSCIRKVVDDVCLVYENHL